MIKTYKVRCHYNSATRVVSTLYKFFPMCSFMRLVSDENRSRTDDRIAKGIMC